MTGVLIRGGNLDTDAYRGTTTRRQGEHLVNIKIADYKPRREAWD